MIEIGTESGRERERTTRADVGKRATRRRRSPIYLACLFALAGIGLLIAPAPASATEKTYTYKIPIEVAAYEVQQGVLFGPRPEVDGFITRMETDIVDESGKQIPIRRLMLHHIVFLDTDDLDATCDSFKFWDSETIFRPAGERFYAAGEERAKLRLPKGYGYPIEANGSPWTIVYMFMNHRAKTDRGFVQYTVTVEDDPSLTPVKPYWMDARNCQADPIYNVPGNGKRGSSHVETSTARIPESGRIVAGGGHAHGGAKKLTLNQPSCSGREIAKSAPTWGLPNHPFYRVKPVLHEPGPIDMSAFQSRAGIPVAAGERVKLKSIYENSRPHVRVMGIFIFYVAPDESASERCAPLPDDMQTLRTDEPGRYKPVPYKIPLTGLDANGNAITIDAPPGKLQKLPKGAKIRVRDRAFLRPNVKVRSGREVTWRFADNELHNVTLANGPKAIGSPNLDGDREFSRTLRKPGTYRFFCSLHPVQMTERIRVVR